MMFIGIMLLNLIIAYIVYAMAEKHTQKVKIFIKQKFGIQ